MSIIVSRESPLEPVPTGVSLAVCANVFDIGWHKGFEGRPQWKVVILWELEKRRSSGERFLVMKKYTASLAERADLLRDLESWRGAPFTPEELKGFDLEDLRGAPCQLNLVAQTSGEGRIFAEVASIMRLQRGQTPLKPETPLSYIPEWVRKMAAEQLQASHEPEPAEEAHPGQRRRP